MAAYRREWVRFPNVVFKAVFFEDKDHEHTVLFCKVNVVMKLW